MFGGILCLGGGFGDGTLSLLLNVKSTNLNSLCICLDSLDSLVSGKTISDSRGKAIMVLELGSGRGTGGLCARVKEHNASDKSDKEFGILFAFNICVFFELLVYAPNVETRLKQARD